MMIRTMADETLDLSELHDAQFLSLDLDWRTGDVRLSFELDGGSSRIPMAGTPTPLVPKQAGPASLVVRAAVEIQTSRVFEWGPSGYVDDATWEPDDAKESGALRIQMQSGDVFMIRGRALEAARR